MFHNYRVRPLGRNSTDLVAAAWSVLFWAKKLIYYKDSGAVYKNFGQPNQKKLDTASLDDLRQMGSHSPLDQRFVSFIGDEIYNLEVVVKAFGRGDETGTKIIGLHNIGPQKHI